MSQGGLFERDQPTYVAKFSQPRDFQVAAHEALRQGVREGHRCQLLMAPTGAGKTFLGLRVAHEALLRERRVIFCCDRTTLIDQTSAVADQYGLSAHGIVQADHWRRDPNARLQIASVQTLASRGWPDADVIVVDEAHTQHRAWTEHVRTCRATVVGLSATPFSPGLGKLFTNLVVAATANELTESGVLVPMRIFSSTRPNMVGAQTTRSGEWTASDAAARGMAIIGDVVSEWQKHASDRKTIVFAASIAHSLEITRQFNESGVLAAAFTSETNTQERDELLREYRKHDSALRALVSVEALAKGFDVPDVGCICDCRPLRKSLSTVIQMWGRGLRSSPETGKKDCLLLDFSGNAIRFANDYSDIFFNGLQSLDHGEKLDRVVRPDDDRDLCGKVCSMCGFQPCGKRCIACGHEIAGPSLIVHEPGHLREIRIGQTVFADDARSLWAQAAEYARTHSAPAKQQWRARLIYRDIAGVFPPHSWNVNSTPSVDVSRPVLNRIKSRLIAYANRLPA